MQQYFILHNIASGVWIEDLLNDEFSCPKLQANLDWSNENVTINHLQWVQWREIPNIIPNWFHTVGDDNCKQEADQIRLSQNADL